MGPGCPVGRPDAASPSRRLESWKEVAAYFGRDVRTVRRWERREALPVHRHRHRSRGSVYAFQEELDRWFERRAAPPVGAPPAGDFAPRPALARRILFLAGPLLVLTLSAWVLVPRARLASYARSLTRPAAAGTRTERDVALEPAVRERFLLARHHLERRAGFRQQALEYLTETIRRAPDFAEAHALLGEAYIRLAVFSPSRRAEAWREAEASVRRALALDVNLSAGHTVLSRILLLRDWNFRGAAAESKRAIDLDPDAPEARAAHALYLRSAGRLEEAIGERQRAQRADPVNPQWLVFLGDEYTFARRFEDARRSYLRALEVERDYRQAVAGLADVHARLERHEEAAVWQMRWLSAGTPAVAAEFEAVWHRDGPRAAADWMDRQTLAECQKDPEDHLWDLAYLHARTGDRDAALRFLERAYDRREAGMLQARVDPDLDSLRGDPRFDDLLRRIGPR